MTAYSSKSGKDNGVISYKIDKDSIILNYKSRSGELRSVIYSYLISGIEHVDKIKQFALSSQDLNSYIAKHRIRCKKIV